ncbi:MAG TPA: conjugal transfer protein TrbC [Syntrophorhabdus aromaticivorans]|nr:conjugal transfer protein TrbC [Syntrophorhabdus aromaticivorans]
MKPKMVLSGFLILGMIFLLPVLAHASGSGLPWETPLQKILDSISGPVAKIAGVIAICLTGLGLAFGEGGGLLRKCLGIDVTLWGVSRLLKRFGSHLCLLSVIGFEFSRK